ncbi:hypothetical protein PVNG_02431 [Plasmodium vivax North Korean]|uniref:Amidase domain-containing protein n=1 Tax=Plasmodium vivax North Korean TaxID=1035514 RepID=A0A0J9W6S2_PLAVI|nr:hypothetical protein PVNG_02431 [Plasmodium vivax North Korean]
MGSAGIFSNRGPLCNVFNEKRVCGGSSSGGSYLVGKGLVDFAIGTDTGGSIRVPASYNSIYGFKPSFGIVSREGIIPFCILLDTPSISAGSIETISRVLSVISGPDVKDLSTVKAIKKSYHNFSSNPLKNLSSCSREKNPKIKFLVLKELLNLPGRPLTYQESILRENFMHLLARLRVASRCTLRSIEFEYPPISLCEAIYKIIVCCDLVTQLLSLNGIVTPWKEKSGRDLSEGSLDRFSTLEIPKEYIEKAREIRSQMGEEVKIRHLLGYFFLYGDHYEKIYLQARKVITLYNQRLSELLEHNEVLISPTTA